MSDKPRSERICILPDCGFLRASRGLCGFHYRQAYQKVKKRKTTWERLEAQGLVLPAT
jgi:hypothetical protein